MNKSNMIVQMIMKYVHVSWPRIEGIEALSLLVSSLCGIKLIWTVNMDNIYAEHTIKCL